MSIYHQLNSFINRILKLTIMVYAYIRVSTSHQILDNQIEEVKSFAERKGIVIDKCIEESASGTKKSTDRKLGALLKKLRAGDTVIVSEISRLSRRMTDIMSIMGLMLERKVTFYSIKENYSFTDDLNSKVMCFAFGIAAEIERNLISMRTREALALRRKNGVRLGRPVGSGKLARMTEEQLHEIAGLNEGRASRPEICRKYHISTSTFYKVRRMHTRMI